jgi:hypothetical protein
MILEPLRDIDVRVPLRTMIRREFDDDSVFLEEMVVPMRDTRIDLAVVNGSFHGFEIKSDVDTLRRLPLQRDSYNALFDQITLVVVSRHVKKALTIIPEWWGVAIANRLDRHVDIEWSRLPSENPSTNPDTVVRLLWRDEVERIILDVGLCSTTSKYYVYELTSLLTANVSADFLRSAVRSALKRRYGVGGRRMSCDD